MRRLLLLGLCLLLISCEKDIPVGGYRKDGEATVRILHLGNSITLHGIVEDLWWGEWGMAAIARRIVSSLR